MRPVEVSTPEQIVLENQMQQKVVSEKVGLNVASFDGQELPPQQAHMVRQAAQVAPVDEVPAIETAVPKIDTQRERSRPEPLSADQKPLSITGEKMFVAKVEQGQLIFETTLDTEIEADQTDVVDVLEEASQQHRARVDARVESQQFQHTNRAVAQQTVVQMKSLINQGGGEVKFSLHPQELGHVEIELEIVRGTVKGAIAVQSPEVADMLSRDLRSLEQSLHESGIALHEDGLTFFLKDEGSHGGDSREDHAHEGDTSEGENHALLADAAHADQQSAGWVSPDALIDVNV